MRRLHATRLRASELFSPSVGRRDGAWVADCPAGQIEPSIAVSEDPATLA
jgi:hypothetical protein